MVLGGVHRDVPRARGARLRAGVRDERVVAVHPRVRAAARPRHQRPGVPRGGDRPHPPRPLDRVPARRSTARSRGARCRWPSSRCAPATRRRACTCSCSAQRMERFHLLDDFWRHLAGVVHRAGGDAHVARRAQLLPLAAWAPLVGHRERRGARRRVAAPRRASTCRSIPRPGSACARGSSRCGRSPTTTASRTTPTRTPAIRSASPRTSSSQACDELVEAGHPGARRPRGGVARLHRLARELRRPAAVARRIHHDAVRAVVVGPVVPLPAPALRCAARRALPELCGRSVPSGAGFVEDPGLGFGRASRRGG